MSTEKIREIIKKRASIDDENQTALEECWNELADALTEDFELTKEFLLEICNEDEASWISEVYDEIVERTQSKKMIEVLRESISRFPEEDKKYNLSENLDLAEKSMLHRLG